MYIPKQIIFFLEPILRSRVTTPGVLALNSKIIGFTSGPNPKTSEFTTTTPAGGAFLQCMENHFYSWKALCY
jgi:hypothetical protein